MVRLTPELIEAAGQCTNAIKDRELDLRGYKIPILENLGATLDQFDTIDLSENEIRKLDGFPFLKRLKSLILIQNKIVRIGENISEYIPNITSLIFTNNNIQDLKDLEPLAGFKHLEFLSLVRNPVTAKPNYRLFVISKVPQVRFLDFRRVRKVERDQAKILFQSEKSGTQSVSKPKTFVPGAELASKTKPPSEAVEEEAEKKLKETFIAVERMPVKRPMSNASQDDFLALRDAIKRAKTMDEVDKLNQLLSSGQYAGFAKNQGNFAM